MKDNKDTMRLLFQKLEEELDSAKSKKVKGTSKKQKEKVGSINYKLTQVKKIKDKLDELALQMDYIDGGTIKQLRGLMKQYQESPDEEQSRQLVE